MKYIANPVEADGFKINRIDLDTESSQITLFLEDGSVFKPTEEMLSRMDPVPGDYVVIQADGYTYLNPKDVFERKYHPATLEEINNAKDNLK